jgi:hypothetical protein
MQQARFTTKSVQNRNNQVDFTPLGRIFRKMITACHDCALFRRPYQQMARSRRFGKESQSTPAPEAEQRKRHMMMKAFLTDDSGAMALDWLVLTAALLGLGLAISAVVSSGVEHLSAQAETEITPQAIVIYK